MNENMISVFNYFLSNRKIEGFLSVHFSFQLNIRARDGGEIPKTSLTSTRYVILVKRNLYTPVFTNVPTGPIAVPKTTTVGTSVFEFTATDADDANDRVSLQLIEKN